MRRLGLAGKRFRRFACGLILTCCATLVVGADLSLAVIYPEVREPYRSVFQEIIAGIEARSEFTVKQYVLSREYDPDALREWLKENNVASIVALGSGGTNAARSFEGELPIISGALMLAPEPSTAGLSGISLAADPGVLFDNLASLAPSIRRIHVIYDPAANAWLVDLARKAADEHRYELIPHTATSLKHSARLYQDVLDTIDPRTDAIWIPVDGNISDEKIILPLVLRQSWQRGIVVFSSNPVHAKKGALFSVYPDNDALGRSLAELAERSIVEDEGFAPRITPLSDVRVALNRRTADDLAININRERQQQFDLVFPSP